MTRLLTNRKTHGWAALCAILLFNVICFGLVDANLSKPTETEEPVQSKQAKRTPKFAKVTELVIGDK